MKAHLKTIYSYIFNLNLLFKFNKIGKRFFLGKRTTLHKCKNSKITIGNDVKIGNDSRFSLYEPDNNPEIIIGNNCYIATHFTIMTASKVNIGNNVLIGSYVSIIGHNHGIDPSLDYGKQKLTSKSIIIEDGCWIGEKVCILPGVKIGKKSIIGTASVVTKNIPDYSIAVGNPAKVIKKYNFKTKKWDNVK